MLVEEKMEKMEVMNNFAKKLEMSGYSNEQRVEIVTCGAKGHTNRNMRLGKAHREAWETSAARDIKKLTGKAKWYKQSKGNQQLKDNKPQGGEGADRPRGKK